MRAFTTGPFTGRHMAAILVGFFAVVIAVNVLMARLASSTFGGVVVENSYVASQHYNRWLKEAAAEKTLGWTAQIEHRKDGRVEVQIHGAPLGGTELTGLAWHPLGRLPDQHLAFAAMGDGRFVSTAPLPAGRWRLRIEAVAGGKRWRSERDVG